MSKIDEMTNPVETGHAPSLQIMQTVSALLRITNEDFGLTESKIWRSAFVDALSHSITRN